MGSTVSVNTYTHSVTFVTDKMLKSLRYIITSVGLDPNKYVEKWASYELAVSTWLQSKHLRSLIIEVVSPSGSLITRCDLTIDYTGSGDGSMWVDTDTLKYAIAKFGAIAKDCSYDITLTTASGEPPVRGWGDGNLRSTEGFTKQNLGTVIGTQQLGAQAAYWRKS